MKDGSQRSGSHVTTKSDLDRMDRYMNIAPHANKYIVKYFGSHWEEMRNGMNTMKQILFMPEIEVPEQYVKQMGSYKLDIGKETPNQEIGSNRQADDIMSGSTKVSVKTG